MPSIPGSLSQSLSILLIEIENLKDVSDALGRNSSDLVLKQVSTRLQGVTPQGDEVAKIDGNVFAILLAENKGVDKAEALAGQILQNDGTTLCS